MSFIEPDQQRVIGPDPVAAVQPAEAAPEAVTAPIDPEAGFDQLPEYWQSHIREKRDAEAKYRTQLREWEQQFDGVDPEVRATLAEFGRLSIAAENGDAEAAARLAELMGDEEEAQPEAPQPLTMEDVRRLAREEADARLAELDAQRTQEQGIQSVIKAAESLGYQQGTKDYILLMQAANSLDSNQFNDRDALMAAAHEDVQAYKQGLIEAYLAGKEADHDGMPRVAVNGAGVAVSRQPWTPEMTEKEKWAAVRSSLTERLHGGR